MATWASTGLDGLDKILCDIKKGDNVVWQVDSIADYCRFVEPYVRQARRQGRNIIYMRFAAHPPVVDEKDVNRVYTLDANTGFETFSTDVHNIISTEGLEAYYVFDCLSDLLPAWATDLMVGNFFMVTCPYLFELDTIAYFAILRNYHSFRTIARIRETTQLLLDVYHFEDNYYIHPLKVWRRYSPTMFLPHIQKGDSFSPVISSADSAKLLGHISGRGPEGPAREIDHWDQLFINADRLLRAGAAREKIQTVVRQLCRIMIGHEKRMSELAEKTFSLRDLLDIRNRLIGSGFIGGKAVGMLLSQKILQTDESFDWSNRLEAHDSFYIGSDVFYTYIVENDWWRLRMEQKTPEGYFSIAAQLREKLLKGKFPEEVRQRFQEMIEYFGQSPIIVRSSSLLEDSFGNAFAGKYESIFLVNQGGPDERYHHFEDAVRRIYASTMNDDALTYRIQRGLDKHDEQMALLVQRVSGSHRKKYFFPDLAGVGVSYNTFVWKSHLDPKAGMLRLVFGLGTRAVNRVEDDYPRIVALDDPLLRPQADKQDILRFSQRKIDLLDIEKNSLTTAVINDILNEDVNVDIDLFAVPDRHAESRMLQMGMEPKHMWIMTFEKLLSEKDFPQTMQRLLKTLEARYEYPVDIEFTVNFTEPDDSPDSLRDYRINLVQCRPLQTKGLRADVKIPSDIRNEKILFLSTGYTMGGSISQPISRIIYVDPQRYTAIDTKLRYDVARLIGKLNRLIESRDRTPTLLMGPGRWGTTTPSLGVPVHFSEINNVAVMTEIAYEGGNLMPELSFGTHFFQDLVESDIFYIAIFPARKEVTFNRKWFREIPSRLTELVPEGADFADVVKVFDVSEQKLQLMCDVISQRVICFFASA